MNLWKMILITLLAASFSGCVLLLEYRRWHEYDGDESMPWIENALKDKKGSA